MLANNLRLTANPRRNLYLTAGSYSFTVPAGVTQIRATAIGGGGSGGDGSGAPNFYVGGGGGGGGSVRATLTVTGGQTVNIVVGGVGASSTVTYVPTSSALVAQAGVGGEQALTANGAPGAGGSYTSGSGWAVVNSLDGLPGVGSVGASSQTFLGLTTSFGGTGSTVPAGGTAGGNGLVILEWSFA